jgi:hypothetical protein
MLNVSALAVPCPQFMLPAMFVVTEADAAAIREIFERDGELSAAIELRRRFLGITDNAAARAHVRMIAGWKPMPRRNASGIALRRVRKPTS